MTDIYDAIVIGAGAMGSAAAYHLAKDGRRTLLLEQFEIGHARGSSHGESRIFRLAYDDANYARLAAQCRPLWRALEAETGERLLLDCAQIDLADDDAHRPYVQAVARTLGDIGADFEVLNAAQMRERYPQWNLDDGAAVVLSRDSGVLRATPCVMAMVTQAARRGAVVRDREAVTDIAAAPGQVEVSTARGRYRARALVVTGGAWVNDLLAPLGLRLPVKVSLEQYAYFQPRDRANFMPGRFPIFIHWRARDAGYGFPTLDQPGVKIGFHFDQQYIEPGADRTPREDGLRRLQDYVRRYLPTAGELAHPTTCLYTTTPDEHFVIDQAPALPNVAFCSACSGHGFKFAIGIGRALADLAQDRATDMHIDHVRWRGERSM